LQEETTAISERAARVQSAYPAGRQRTAQPGELRAAAQLDAEYQDLAVLRVVRQLAAAAAAGPKEPGRDEARLPELESAAAEAALDVRAPSEEAASRAAAGPAELLARLPVDAAAHPG